MPLLVVAIGQTFVLIVAGIDLSAPSIIAMASVVGASVMTGDGGYARRRPPGRSRWASSPSSPSAALIGAFNGACTTRFDMPSFIVTLTTMMFFSGAAIWFTAAHDRRAARSATCRAASSPSARARIVGVPYSLDPDRARRRGRRPSRPQPHASIGRWLYAVGLNPRAAAVSGVPVAARRRLGLRHLRRLRRPSPSMLYTGRLETGTPVLGQRILLDVDRRGGDRRRQPVRRQGQGHLDGVRRPVPHASSTRACSCSACRSPRSSRSRAGSSSSPP